MSALRRQPALAAAALAAGLTALATLANAAGEERVAVKDTIAWTVSPDVWSNSSHGVQFSYETSMVSVKSGDGEDLAEMRAAISSAGPVNFTIVREPGTLTCRGTMKLAQHGRGTCTFAPDNRFTAGLRARQLGPRDWRDQLAMTLLGVDQALIGGLDREGVPARSADDLIGAAAVDVTPDYIAEIKDAGFELTSLDDAIACRALEIDALYVKAMASAGYGGSVQQVISMKAVGVTPEYAERMNAAVQK